MLNSCYNVSEETGQIFISFQVIALIFKLLAEKALEILTIRLSCSLFSSIYSCKLLSRFPNKQLSYFSSRFSLKSQLNKKICFLIPPFATLSTFNRFFGLLKLIQRVYLFLFNFKPCIQLVETIR